MPDHALFVAFVFMAVVTVVSLVLFARVSRQARGKARAVLASAALTVALIGLQIMCLWLERGTFTATSIFQTLVKAAAALWGTFLAEVSSQ